MIVFYSPTGGVFESTKGYCFILFNNGVEILLIVVIKLNQQLVLNYYKFQVKENMRQEIFLPKYLFCND